MTVSIHIPLPVLVGTQYFVVMYRLQGSPTWIDISPKTNTPFNIGGLAAGVYELWMQLGEGTSPEIYCDERIDTFTVSEDANCFDYNFELVNEGRIVTLNVTFTDPSPWPALVCAIEITYGISGQPLTNQTVTLNAPVSSPISLPASANDYEITVRQISCDGHTIICANETVEYVPVDCTPMTFGAATLNYHPDATWWIVLTFTQSTPYTNPFNVAYDQNNTVNTGIPDPGGSINLTANAMTTHVTFQVLPNIDVTFTNSVQRLFYEGNITDGCGFSTKWACFFDLN